MGSRGATLLACSKCEQDKPTSDFYRNSRQTRGYHHYCKPCTRAYDRARYPNGKPRRYARRLERDYGITIDDFNRMLGEQGGRCAICRRDGQLVVDHDHGSGVVRGLLCAWCNRALGFLGDDYRTVAQAAAYLARSIQGVA
jgi:hypothetical protein